MKGDCLAKEGEGCSCTSALPEEPSTEFKCCDYYACKLTCAHVISSLLILYAKEAAARHMQAQAQHVVQQAQQQAQQQIQQCI
jgi:hypothetical protein